MPIRRYGPEETCTLLTPLSPGLCDKTQIGDAVGASLGIG